TPVERLVRAHPQRHGDGAGLGAAEQRHAEHSSQSVAHRRRRHPRPRRVTAGAPMVPRADRPRCYVPGAASNAPLSGMQRGDVVGALADILIIFKRSPVNGWEFLFRWAHVLAGITWIGLLYYFNFVQVPSFAELDAGARNQAVDKLASRALWWFRWAAV